MGRHLSARSVRESGRKAVCGLVFEQDVSTQCAGERYEHFIFDLQVRYALGYEHLSEGYFAIRTICEFRRRLSEHMQATGENLFEAAFEQVTDDQISLLNCLKQPAVSMKRRSILFAAFNRHQFTLSRVGSHCFNFCPVY